MKSWIGALMLGAGMGIMTPDISFARFFIGWGFFFLGMAAWHDGEHDG